MPILRMPSSQDAASLHMADEGIPHSMLSPDAMLGHFIGHANRRREQCTMMRISFTDGTVGV